MTNLDRVGKNLHYFKCRMRLTGYGPKSDLEYRAGEVSQCHAFGASYKIENGLNIVLPKNTTSRDVKKQKRSNGGD